MRKIAASIGLWLSLVPGPVWAVKYRIDPRPRDNSAETAITQPWTMLEFLKEAPKKLLLLNFVVDEEPDRTEGIDFPKYDRRADFGTWIVPSPETDCYNTRAKILIRDSDGAVVFSDANPCVVATGKWHDPYTGSDVSNAKDLDIDHLVPLKNAYVSGAWKWDEKKRCHYANFIAYDSHLLAVSARENRVKGNRTPANYMPPDDHFTCDYLNRWLNVKAVWDLTLDEDEAQVIQTLMETHRCGVRYQTVTAAKLKSLRQHTTEITAKCN